MKSVAFAVFLSVAIAGTALAVVAGIVSACTPDASTSNALEKSEASAVRGALLGASLSTPTFSYLAGSDGGAVTIPTGRYVTQLWTGPGTFTILPVNPYTEPVCTYVYTDAGDAGGYTDASNAPCQDAAGPPLVVPSGTTYSTAVPALFPGGRGLADGTVLTFGAGQSYAVTLSTYSYP